MSTIKITKEGDPILHGESVEVPASEITTPKIQKIIKDMSTALSKEKYGVAIAAPQIGIPLRIFVVAGSVFDRRRMHSDNSSPDQVFINPRILKTSRRKQESHESCLSIQGRPEKYGPDVAGIVKRPDKMTIEAYNEKGEKSERGASSFLASIFDHEIDHLNGILFIDKTIDQWEIDSDFNKVG